MRVTPGEGFMRPVRESHARVRGAALVMREDQVRAARLDVEYRPEVVGRDRGALHMPPRPARAETRAPGRLPRPGREPYQAVQRVLLARPARVAAPLGGQRQHVRRAEVRDGPELRVGGPGEVDVAVYLVQGTAVGQDPVHLIDQR